MQVIPKRFANVLWREELCVRLKGYENTEVTGLAVQVRKTIPYYINL